MQVKIARSEWLRGSGFQLGVFYDPTTTKCCVVGHVLRALGATDDEIRDKGSVAELSAPLQYTLELGAGLLPGDPVTCAVTEINDDAFLADDLRETMLIREFGRLGVDLTFYDGDPE